MTKQQRSPRQRHETVTQDGRRNNQGNAGGSQGAQGAEGGRGRPSVRGAVPRGYTTGYDPSTFTSRIFMRRQLSAVWTSSVSAGPSNSMKNI